MRLRKQRGSGSCKAFAAVSLDQLNFLEDQEIGDLELQQKHKENDHLKARKREKKKVCFVITFFFGSSP